MFSNLTHRRNPKLQHLQYTPINVISLLFAGSLSSPYYYYSYNPASLNSCKGSQRTRHKKKILIYNPSTFTKYFMLLFTHTTFICSCLTTILKSWTGPSWEHESQCVLWTPLSYIFNWSFFDNSCPIPLSLSSFVLILPSQQQGHPVHPTEYSMHLLILALPHSWSIFSCSLSLSLYSSYQILIDYVIYLFCFPSTAAKIQASSWCRTLFGSLYIPSTWLPPDTQKHRGWMMRGWMIHSLYSLLS